MDRNIPPPPRQGRRTPRHAINYLRRPQTLPNQQFYETNSRINRSERPPYPDNRHTKYFWTVNTQIAPANREQAEYLAEKLKRAVVEVLTNGANLVAFAHPNHAWNAIYVNENLLRIAVEVGPKRARVHAHVIQDIAHRSNINIEAIDVQNLVGERLSQLTGGFIDQVYVRRTRHPSERPLEEYIFKDHPEYGTDDVKRLWTYKLYANEPLETDGRLFQSMMQSMGIQQRPTAQTAAQTVPAASQPVPEKDSSDNPSAASSSGRY